MIEAAFSLLLKSALLLQAALAPPVAGGPTTRIVDYSQALGPATITHDGAEVTLLPVRDALNGEWIEVTASIRVPGYPAVRVNEGAPTSRHYDRWVGIGRLSRTDSMPAVLLAGFSGGAHCCATLTAVVPYEGRLRVLEFEAVDGEPEQPFPKDIDLDGVVDIVRQDDRFRYAFAGGGRSWSPPVVFNIVDGQIVDVTTRPGFRHLWEDYAREARVHCADRSNEGRNGACAAYVAAAARLGNYPEAMREVETIARSGADIILPTGCRIALVDDECPAGQETTFRDFPSALSWFLQAHGYTR